jgi:hypothetical protein
MLNQYWEYAGTRYRHKFKLLDASGGDYHNVKYNIFENSDSFYSYDWTIEPAQTLYDLMLERAMQLRDTYSYLKFWFSGGADSSSVLKVFLDNKIHIDEIITYKFAPVNNESDAGDYELEEYTLPYLSKLQKELPKTKFKIITYDKDYFDKFLTDKWFENKNTLSIRHAHMPKIRGKNFCNIICDSDPNIDVVDGKWCAQLWDSDNYVEFGLYRNVECFFTSPSLPKLHAKQCHMMMNHLKSLYEKKPEYSIFKQHVRDVVRFNPVAPEPWWFKKTHNHNSSINFSAVVKDKFSLRSMTDYQKDKYRYILNTTINNRKVFRIGHSFLAHSFCLEE